jgi:hypothetical protein
MEASVLCVFYPNEVFGSVAVVRDYQTQLPTQPNLPPLLHSVSVLPILFSVTCKRPLNSLIGIVHSLSRS